MLTYDAKRDRWVTTPDGVPPDTRSKINPDIVARMRRHDPEAIRDVIDWLFANGWSAIAHDLRRELGL